MTISLSEDDSRIILSVVDTGVGVAANELARIFERFYRCDRSRGQGGNGLGLSLALAIVRAHGGDISVSSTLGVGTRFSVTLARVLPAQSLQTI